MSHKSSKLTPEIGDLVFIQIGSVRRYSTIDTFNIDAELKDLKALCEATVYSGSNGFPETVLWPGDIVQNFGQISYDDFKKKYPQRFI